MFLAFSLKADLEAGRQRGRMVRAEDFESNNSGSIPAQYLLHDNPEFHLIDLACK